MRGRSIYFSEKEIELLKIVFDYGNIGFEGSDNEEEKWEIAEKIREKVSKIDSYYKDIRDFKQCDECEIKRANVIERQVETVGASGLNGKARYEKMILCDECYERKC